MISGAKSLEDYLYWWPTAGVDSTFPFKPMTMSPKMIAQSVRTKLDSFQSELQFLKATLEDLDGHVLTPEPVPWMPLDRVALRKILYDQVNVRITTLEKNEIPMMKRILGLVST
jgi:hypothetical protein